MILILKPLPYIILNLKPSSKPAKTLPTSAVAIVVPPPPLPISAVAIVVPLPPQLESMEKKAVTAVAKSGILVFLDKKIATN